MKPSMDTDTIITLPRDVLESARLSVQEAKQELALSLYAQGRLLGIPESR